jgi:hypothetical protein
MQSALVQRLATTADAGVALPVARTHAKSAAEAAPSMQAQLLTLEGVEAMVPFVDAVAACCC